MGISWPNAVLLNSLPSAAIFSDLFRCQQDEQMNELIPKNLPFRFTIYAWTAFIIGCLVIGPVYLLGGLIMYGIWLSQREVTSSEIKIDSIQIFAGWPLLLGAYINDVLQKETHDNDDQ